jgi:hypothetical protein
MLFFFKVCLLWDTDFQSCFFEGGNGGGPRFLRSFSEGGSMRGNEDI